MRVKYHGFRYIVDRLREAGVINSITREGGVCVLKDWIKHGYIKLRRKPPGMYYKASDKEIAQIIKDFSVGGDGWWEPGKKYPLASAEGPVEGTSKVTEAREAFVATGDTQFVGFSDSGVKPWVPEVEGSLAQS